MWDMRKGPSRVVGQAARMELLPEVRNLDCRGTDFLDLLKLMASLTRLVKMKAFAGAGKAWAGRPITYTQFIPLFAALICRLFP